MEARRRVLENGLKRPPRNGGWVIADEWGYTCCVAQGNYGHRAQKLTWLYAVGTKRPDLKWGLCPNKVRIDPGFHSKEEAKRLRRTGICQRLSKRQRAETPIEFRDLLMSLLQ